MGYLKNVIHLVTIKAISREVYTQLAGLFVGYPLKPRQPVVSTT
jgi:hypothetical protein